MSKKHRGKTMGEATTRSIPLPAGGVQLETFIPWTLVRRGDRKQVITPLDAPQAFQDEAQKERQARELEQDTPLMRALGLAHYWQKLLEEKRFPSLTEIAEAEGIDLAQTSRIAKLVFLSPTLVETFERGERKAALGRLTRGILPASWALQHEMLAGGNS